MHFLLVFIEICILDNGLRVRAILPADFRDLYEEDGVPNCLPMFINHLESKRRPSLSRVA